MQQRVDIKISTHAAPSATVEIAKKIFSQKLKQQYPDIQSVLDMKQIRTSVFLRSVAQCSEFVLLHWLLPRLSLATAE